MQHISSFFAMKAVSRALLSRRVVTNFRGLRITVLPGIFHPKPFFSTNIFADHLEGLDLRTKRVLEIGTGSGVLALCAARKGATVLATDLNPTAVESARINILANHFEDSVTARVGNLFEPVLTDETFDLILWNPPFFPFPRTDMSSYAWNAGPDYEVLHLFADQVAGFLRPSGKIILLFSSFMDIPLVLSFFTARDLTPTLVRSKRKIFEVFHVYEFVFPQ